MSSTILRVCNHRWTKFHLLNKPLTVAPATFIRAGCTSKVSLVKSRQWQLPDEVMKDYVILIMCVASSDCLHPVIPHPTLKMSVRIAQHVLCIDYRGGSRVY